MGKRWGAGIVGGGKLAAVLALLAACGRSPELEIVDVVATPPSVKIPAGREIPLRIDIRNPRNLPVEFEWTAKRGTMVCAGKSDPVCIYRAPSEDGTDMVRVVAIAARVEKFKEISLAIEPPPGPSGFPSTGGAVSAGGRP